MDVEVLRLVNELIPALRDYLQQEPVPTDGWMAEFGEWLRSTRSSNPDSPFVEDETTDILIGIQLVTVFNRLRVQMNKFVADSPFSTYMDYQFLFVIGEHDEMTKSELIVANSMEMSSGIEIVNRLLKREWISEAVNPQDKRSKIVAPTSAGREVVAEYKQRAQAIYTSISQKLPRADKATMLALISDLTGQAH